MIADNIQKQTIDAMKAKDTVRVSTLRMLNSELKNARIDKREDLSQEEELEVVAKEAKKRRDSIAAYKEAGRDELVASETAELEVLEEFLPEAMSGAELESIVNKAIKSTGASTMSDMGKVMSLVLSKTKGAADGKKVSDMVKQKLS